MKSIVGSLKTFTVGITSSILIISSLPTAALAQAQPKTKLNIRFPKISKVGAPSRTTGTGARKAPCGFKNFDSKEVADSTNSTDDNKITFTALTPENNTVTTIAANPSIYVYLPKTVKKFVEFRMIDIKNETVVYETTFPLSKNPGIIKVSTPKTVNLESGKRYQWQFLVMCNPQDREADEIVEGWVERTALTPEQQENIDKTKLESLEKAQLYAEYGVWNESINILAELRDRNPLAKDLWMQLLSSVKLGDIAQNTLIDCCSIPASPLSQSKNHNGIQ